MSEFGGVGLKKIFHRIHSEGGAGPGVGSTGCCSQSTSGLLLDLEEGKSACSNFPACVRFPGLYLLTS